MSEAHDRPAGAAGDMREMSAQEEEELRAAYEEQLRRITATELVLQASASLLNLGARRMGLGEGGAADRDLDQVRDAVDAVRGLLPVLERRTSAAQLAPLRDALSQLQMAYARELQSASRPGSDQPDPGSSASGQEPGAGAVHEGAGAAGSPAEGASPDSPEADTGHAEGTPGEHAGGPAEESTGGEGAAASEPGQGRRPGPAESSGRLWVPGKG